MKFYLFFFSALLGAVASVQVSAAEPAGQAVGFFSKGKLVNPTHLVESGTGYVQLFPWRDRGWGTEGLVALIENSASEVLKRYPDGERLQLGDLSAQAGGFISGHGSHQNGLDVDFIYLRMNRQEQPQTPLRITGFDEQFVRNGTLTKNFDLERNWAFMKILVAAQRINRIFVDPVIKAGLCRYARRIGEFEIETLRKLRPLDNHGDHMHVRLTCPVESPECVTQVEIPPGSGCE